MTTPSRVRVPAHLLAVFTLLGAFFTLTMLVASPAHADGETEPPPIEVELEVGGEVGNQPCGLTCDEGDPDDGGGGGGGTDGGGGNGVQVPAGGYSESGQGFFPSNPPNRIGGRAPGQVEYTDDSTRWFYNNKCDGNYSWGSFSEPYIGWRWFEIGALVPPFIEPGGEDDTLPPNLRKAIYGGYTCIKPPLYREKPVRCAVYADGYLDGPMSNPEYASTRRNFPRERTAFDRGGRDNPALCNQSYTFNITAQPTAWGQYQLNLQARQVYCTQRTYYTVDQRTGRVPAAEILRCGSAMAVANDQARAELFCEAPYWHDYWTNNYSFTAADCGSTTWQCNLGGAPTFAGVLNTDPVAVLDDGKEHRVTWAQPNPTGDIRNIRDEKVRLDFISGSPFRVGTPANGDTQPFMVDPALTPEFRTGWQQNASNSRNTAYDLKFMAAGIADEPWKARPTWSFRAGFAFYVPTWKMDTATGRLYQSGLTKDWVASNATCVGTAMKVDVHRARNSS